jgi:apolipoprotein N-acyltransferase
MVALGADPRSLAALRFGYVTGAVSALGLLYWTSFVVVQYGGLSLAAGAAVMVLLCLAFALFPALFGWTVGRWVRAFGPAALLLAPFAWVGTEILRAHTFFRFPWCLLGYSQQPNLPYIQVARFGAVYAVSFVLAAASAGLAYAALEPRRGRGGWGLAAVLIVVVLVGADGAVTLSRPLPEAGRLRVGLVQARILQDEKWVPEAAEDHIAQHVRLTRRAAEDGARLVVWPESSVPFPLDESPPARRRLESLARELGIYLLFGNDDVEARGGRERIFVGAKMLDPRGRLVYRYHKMHLVPFGEYVPLEPVFTLGGRVAARVVSRVGQFTPGAEAAVGTAAGARLGTFICYEAIFPGLVRRFTEQGAELLVNVTNDGWYGRTSAPHQHLAMAVFRAVENGRTLVRAANTGITAVVDARGRVLERTALFDRTVLVRDVPLLRGSTFYARHGDLFGWGSLLVSLGVTAAAFARRNRGPLGDSRFR